MGPCPRLASVLCCTHAKPRTAWPALPYAEWADTCETLHLWTQVVGKVRLAQTPWLNHSWQTPLYLTPRGLTTGLIPHGTRALDIEFDFVDQVLRVRTDGPVAEWALRPMPVSEFHAKVMDTLEALGTPVAIHGAPNEMPTAIPFAEDRAPRAYDGAYAQRFWRVLLAADRVLKRVPHRLPRQGQPGALLLGQLRPGGDPVLRPAGPASPRRRAASARRGGAGGLFPRGQQRRLLAGRAGAQDAAFYSYAYPEPPGFRSAAVSPPEARYDATLGEFVLPYEAVRAAPDPDAALLAFLSSTYAAAADLAGWDRAALECALGEPGKPRAALRPSTTRALPGGPLPQVGGGGSRIAAPPSLLPPLAPLAEGAGAQAP